MQKISLPSRRVGQPDISRIEKSAASPVRASLPIAGAAADGFNASDGTPLIPGKKGEEEEKTRGAVDKTIHLLRSRTGNDFSFYKRNTLCRRIERRMGIHQISRMADYVRFLQEAPQEIDVLFHELLIGVTSFFRDPAVWDQLSARAIPDLIMSRGSRQALRVWVPGCSTGEEAYSLAIVLKEAIEQIRPSGNFAIQIFATDLDRTAIDKARQGLYPEGIAADMSESRLNRFFAMEERGYRVRKEIREMVIFAPQNLIMDPPFTRLDILSCRNLMIYLTSEVQKKLIPLFHYSLSPSGILFLGSAETIGDGNDLFTPLSGKSRIYRRTDSALRTAQVIFPTSFSSASEPAGEARPALPTAPSIQSQADRLVLQRYAPPAVLTSASGSILYVSGRTGKYLEPTAGKANWNIFAMAREGLKYELEKTFQEALRKKGCATLKGITLGSDREARRVDLTVEQLDENGPLNGLVMVLFTDVPQGPPQAEVRPSGPPDRNSRVAELERELLQVHGEARASQEEMQTSQEELRSANEELQSTNEELQSANEELTTSKEEMQSMNEELQTVNTELQAKLDELSRASSDMKNLLDSTDIATLFLDKSLNVRRFTSQAAKIIHLISADVGRPITDLSSELRYPGLSADAHEVLRTLTPLEKPVAGRAGRWFSVRIMPYRTLDDRIDGVVITFTNITAAKTLEAELRSRSAGLKKAVTPRPSGKPRAGRKSPRARKS